MIYPKIPRKSLALLLICLIFTLAAVGIMFIIYFFNTNNTLLVKPILKKLYNEGGYYNHHNHQQEQEQEQQQQQQKQQHQQREHQQHQQQEQNHQSLLQESDKDIDNSDSFQSYTEGEKRRNLKTSKKDIKTYRSSFLENIDEFSDENFNENKNNYYTNSDTIYIDDYDRINEKIDSNNNGGEDLLNINGIDYFDAIIMDHNHRKTSKNTNDKLRTATQTSLNAKEKDLLIFTKALYNQKNYLNQIINRKSKNYRNKNNNRNNDGENFDNETIGSGSGDFIDDTEVDDEQKTIGKILKKRLKENNNRRNSLKKDNYHNFRIDNQSDNLYSVSSEIVSNLSNESSLKPALLPSSMSSLNPENTSSTSISTSTLPLLVLMTSSVQPSLLLSSAEIRNNRINKLDKKTSGSVSSKKWMPPSIVSSREIVTTIANQSPENRDEHQNGAWLETRARRIMGNVKKSEERSRQLLLCEEAGGGELCRMLFKGHLNE